MAITTDQVKELRDRTGVSVMQCKKALEEAGGDMEKARILIQKQSKLSAEKKGDRTLGAGIVGSYVHTSKDVGAMVLLSCETDFVAKNEEFGALARDIAMQVAATDPRYIRETDISEDERAKARETFMPEVKGKPADLQEKILEGKLSSYFAPHVLLTQTFIKDPERTVKDLVDAGTQKFGERVEVTRIARFSARG
jgi:elongation factor Ts